MKKLVMLIITVSCFLIVSACNTVNDGAMPEIEKNADEVNPLNEVEPKTNQDINQQLGYVRYSKDEIDVDRENNHEAKIDRPEMAEMITKLILRNDGFQEAATLVTDKEVFIAYQKDENADSERMADIAKKTAESTMPRFYSVYVSENESLMYDIQSLHNSSTNREYDNLIQQLKKEMEKTPQGINNNNQT
ncbi:YhcN/YlaJ family sporulation lipoprotein [Oceanobacillus senegalensis]|uniref:YhcN/YlaJ family sporulation lipoprotein n=1 Tax=Oceanobacillus senegalensis TaxID=1936063 RepID=UPI000A304FE7|nr:YhcN/YlaJ family sporulation lipoprotein [Oceanobacillus senegalensis]